MVFDIIEHLCVDVPQLFSTCKPRLLVLFLDVVAFPHPCPSVLGNLLFKSFLEPDSLQFLGIGFNDFLLLATCLFCLDHFDHFLLRLRQDSKSFSPRLLFSLFDGIRLLFVLDVSDLQHRFEHCELWDHNL